MFKKIFFLFAVFIATCQLLFSTENQGDSLKVYKLPSITVTTSRAEIGKTPVPFSELSKSELDSKYLIKDIPDMLSEMPSIMFYSENGNSIGYSDLSMRGFDQTRISVLINGIPQNDPEDHGVYWLDFPDLTANLNDIQIQRGAGLTHFGEAAIGGSINLSTSDFVNEKGIKIFSGIGYQEYGANNKDVLQSTMNKQSIELSSGMIGNYAIYARLSRINSSGYRDRSWVDMNSFFISGARFDKNVITQINIFGGPISDGLAYTGLPKSYIGNLNLRRENPGYWQYDSTGSIVDKNYYMERRKQETEWFSQPHFEILNDWYLNDNITIKSALFYYTGSGYYDYDASWADGLLTDLMSKDFTFDSTRHITNSLVRAWVMDHQGGWLPRIIWDQKWGELTAGAEIRFHRADHYGNLSYSEYLPQNFDTDYKIYSYTGIRNAFSFFARERINLNEQFALSGELQYVNQTYGISDEKAGNHYTQYNTTQFQIVGNGAELFNIQYNFLNPRVGLNYIYDESLNFFSLLAYTSREPRMRNLYPADDAYFGGTPQFEGSLPSGGPIRYDFSKPIVKPENMLDFELGMNYTKEKYFFSLNFYLMDYTNELVKSGMLDIFGNPIDGNAPRSNHYGVELQGSVILYKHSLNEIKISGNATFSRNRIIEYNYHLASGGSVSLANNPIAGFPDVMANLRLTYIYENFHISILGKYVGQFYTDNYGSLLTTNTLLINDLIAASNYYTDNKVDPYVVFNGDVSYTFNKFFVFPNLKIQMQINNIFNRLYAAGGAGKEFFPAAERNIFIGIQLGI
ncbi:MAG: TonB-dependent receptor [FCB group bacterium]|jgi:iron complex outermembrane receptor protein